MAGFNFSERADIKSLHAEKMTDEEIIQKACELLNVDETTLGNLLQSGIIPETNIIHLVLVDAYKYYLGAGNLVTDSQTLAGMRVGYKARNVLTVLKNKEESFSIFFK